MTSTNLYIRFLTPYFYPNFQKIQSLVTPTTRNTKTRKTITKENNKTLKRFLMNFHINHGMSSNIKRRKNGGGGGSSGRSDY